MSSFSTSTLLMSFPRDEEFEGKTRYEKGFWYEMFTQTLLKTNSVEFFGNPNSFSDWNSNQTKGYDIRVSLPNGETQKVECKLVLNPIFHSWFERDWLSRDADVYVTNSVYSVSYRDRRTLRQLGKRLLSTTEFIMYIQKMLRGNKYAYLNKPYSPSNISSSNQEVQSISVTDNTRKERTVSLLSFMGMKEPLPGSSNAGALDSKRSILDCKTCRKREWCDTFHEYKSLKAIKPRKSSVQDCLSSYLDGKPQEVRNSYKDKKKEWFSTYCDVALKRFKCLSKRSYLHLNKGYKMFDIN